jgi:hypothetical protein
VSLNSSEFFNISASFFFASVANPEITDFKVFLSASRVSSSSFISFPD